MKISTAILEDLNACASGFVRFKTAHGDNEIMFSDCVKSESNTISDCLWFVRKQSLNDDRKKDLQFLAIEFAERVLPIFEARYPDDNRPRTAIETAKLYLSGESTLYALKEARTATFAAAANAAACAAYAAAAAAAAAAYAAADAADPDADAADAAAVAAAAAANAAAYAAERPWQKQRLAELMIKWGW
jgi:hypothetical protein